MTTSDKELKKIASLAYIETDEKSAHQLAEDVNAIMNFMEKLREVDTTNIEPLLHPLKLNQRLRIDEVKETSVTNALKNIAPLFKDDLYLVPKVIDTLGK